MSKELEALERIKYKLSSTRANGYWEDLDIIEDALKQQENDVEIWKNYLKEIKNLPHIEVQMKLKGFDIINKKNVCIHDFKKSKTLEEYNGCREWEEQLTKEEYSLLKEVLL